MLFIEFYCFEGTPQQIRSHKKDKEAILHEIESKIKRFSLFVVERGGSRPSPVIGREAIEK